MANWCKAQLLSFNSELFPFPPISSVVFVKDSVLYCLRTRHSPSRCTLAKATDQHHERVSRSARARQLSSFQAFGPQGEVLLDGLTRQEARSASWEPKARGMSALVRGRLAAGKPTLVPIDAVVPSSFQWYNTNIWSVAQVQHENYRKVRKHCYEVRFKKLF